MKRVIVSVLSCALLTGTATLSFAADDKEGKIKQRKENQQKRIAKGVENGSLTPARPRVSSGKSPRSTRKYARIAKKTAGNSPTKKKPKGNPRRNGAAR